MRTLVTDQGIPGDNNGIPADHKGSPGRPQRQYDGFIFRIGYGGIPGDHKGNMEAFLETTKAI